MEYTVYRSHRKTVSLEITPALEIVVRAPWRMSDRDIAAFADAHADWIAKHIKIQKERALRHPEPSAAQEALLRKRAREELPPLVAQYAARMGVRPTGIRITGARKRFGSCSGKNALCFSFRLMEYPQAAIEYVVVHELAHIRHHDHSAAFYAIIASVLPDYRQREKILRE